MVIDLFSQFTIRDYIILVGILLAQIPFIIMIRYYIKTKMVDFALGAGILISGSLSLLFTQFFFLQQLWMYIVANICFITTYYLLVLHSLRYRWHHVPRQLTGIISLIYSSIVFCMLMYRFETIRAVEPMLFGFDMLAIDRKTGGVPAVAAIFQWQGKIIVGSSFLLLVDLFKLLSASVFLIVYVITPLSYDTPITRKNRLIMIITGILNVIHPILITVVGLRLIAAPYIIFNLLNASFILLLAYIGMIHPETLLLSQEQVLRILSLYTLLEKYEQEKQKKEQEIFLGMKSVMSYIDWIAELKETGKV